MPVDFDVDNAEVAESREAGAMRASAVREPSIKALHLAGAVLPFAAGCLSVRAVPGIAELA